MASQDNPDSDPEDTNDINLFAEPADYYPPSPTPTTETHTLLSRRTLTLSLVGHNPLWGHHLWNAGRIISTHLETHPALIQHKTVLELGAGAGLPSLVSAVLGATKVVVTDYPDPDLVQNLWKNISTLEVAERANERIVAEGYCWGADTSQLLSHLPPPPPPPSSEPEKDVDAPGFDVLILADLLFNHSEHEKLVRTIELTLSRRTGSRALVFFTPYRPWLYEKDLAFFDVCRERGFQVEKILEEKMEKVMFEDDPGDEELRRTVFGFEVTWTL